MFTKKILTTAVSLLLICVMIFSLSACGKEKPAHEIYKDNIDEFVKDAKSRLSDVTDSSTNSIAMQGELTLAVELGDILLDMLEDETDMDLSWINDVELSSKFKFSNMISYVKATIAHSNKTLFSPEMYADMENGEMLLSFGEYSDGYFSVPVEDGFSESYIGAVTSGTPANLMGNLFTDEFFDLVGKYLYMVADLYKDVEGYEETLEANGVSEECTAYELKLYEDDIIEFAEKVINTVIEDEDFKSVYIDLAKMMGEMDAEEARDNYHDFIEELESIRDSIDDMSLDLGSGAVFAHTTYVKDDEIIGSEIKVNTGSEKIVASFAKATDKKKTGVELSVGTKGQFGMDYLDVSGEYTESKNKMNGSFKVSVLGNEVLSVTVTDVDTKKLEDNYLKGTITLEAGDDLETMLSSFGIYGEFSDIVKIIEDYKIKITSDMSENKADINVSVLEGSKLFCSVHYTLSTDDDKVKIDYPNSNITDDAYEWVSEENWNDLIDTVEDSELPNDIKEIIVETIEEILSTY